MLSPAQLDLIDTAVPDLVAVWLFGSEAAGSSRSDSDVDIAVLAARPIASEALYRLKNRLEAELRRDVDLIDLATASTVLTKEVLTGGRRLLVCDPTRADLFEIMTMREYEDLKYRRAGIEADIAARGRVFR